jgi:hypothetical protein
MRSATIVALLAAMLGAGAAAAQSTGAPPVEDRVLIRMTDGIDNAVDSKDWARARSFFADEVRVDFSSLSGSPPATIRSDDLIKGWSQNLKSSKTSLHLRTNHDVAWAGEVATVRSHGYAWNRMEGQGDPLWEVWGVYEHTFGRVGGAWKVTGFVFRMTHERGNMWVRTHVPDR